MASVIPALMRLLWETLDPAAFTSLNRDALARSVARCPGWSADDIASQVVGSWPSQSTAGDRARLVVHRVNQLAGLPPPHTRSVSDRSPASNRPRLPSEEERRKAAEVAARRAPQIREQLRLMGH